MNPAVVVVTDKTIHFRKGLFVVLEAVSLVAFSFQDAVERFDVGILVWRFDRYPLVLDSGLLTERVEILAHKLGPIIGTQNEGTFLLMNTPLEERFLQRVQNGFRVARLASVVSYNGSVEDIDNARQIKVPSHSRHVAILNVHLPQLIGAGYRTVIGNALGYGIRLLTLRGQEIHFFAQSVYLLLVDDELVPSAQERGDLTVTKRGIRPLQDPPNVTFDSGVRHLIALFVVRKPWYRTTLAFWLLALGVLKRVVVG